MLSPKSPLCITVKCGIHVVYIRPPYVSLFKLSLIFTYSPGIRLYKIHTIGMLPVDHTTYESCVQ